MPITTGLCTRFKVGLLRGEFDLSTTTSQTFKLALYTSDADLDADTLAYTTAGEVAAGNGYISGGEVVTVSIGPTSTGRVAYVDFNDVTWSMASFTARGALLYKADGVDNPAIAVFDFGEDKTTSQANLVVQFPPGNSTQAVVRLT